jgi:hypothetical protein
MDKTENAGGVAIESTPLLAISFSELWHRKWPNQTRDVKRLEMSAHYTGCREAFYAGAGAAADLCRIYFEIAAECIGEDEVRKRRDARIANARSQPPSDSEVG